MLVIHIQVAPVQMHISPQQYHSQDRKTPLCQVLWSADIKKPQTKLCYFSHAEGKSLWNSVFLTPVLRLQLSETKAFHTKTETASWVEKLRDTVFIPTLLKASPGPALPSPCRLYCCQHAWSHTWPRRTEKTWMAYFSDRGYYWGTDRVVITLPECTAPGVWLPLHTFSVQLVFLQEKVEFSFSEAGGFCTRKLQSRGKLRSLRCFLPAHTLTQCAW